MVLPSESRRAVFERLRASMGAGALPAPDRWPTGIAVLDAALGGGLRRGSLVLVGGVPGSGRWSLIAALLRTVTASAWAAILDDGSLYPPGLVRAGVRLERLVVVPSRGGRGDAGAVETLLQSGAFGVIVVPAAAALPWRRLERRASCTRTLVVAAGEPHDAEIVAVAATRLRCTTERPRTVGLGRWLRTIAGYTVRIRIERDRAAPPICSCTVEVEV